jgi:hypothetical protein
MLQVVAQKKGLENDEHCERPVHNSIYDAIRPLSQSPLRIIFLCSHFSIAVLQYVFRRRAVIA